MATFTKEAIFAAADELAANGQRATLALVRAKLGGGSFTTISEAMNEWKAKREMKEAPMRDPAPQAITERCAELGGEIWAVALDLANGRLTSEREALETARLQLEGEKQEATELADQVAAELEAEQQRHAETSTKLSAALAELATIKAKAEAAQEQQAEHRKRTAEEVHRITERMTKAESDRDIARKEAMRAREEAAKLRGELEATKAQAAALIAALKPENLGKTKK